MSTKVGSIHYDLSLNIKGFNSAVDGVGSKLAGLESKSKSMNESFVKTGAVMGAVSGVVQSVFNRAINTMSNSIDGAIKRVDTLNNSQRTFANMGISSVDAKNAVNALDKSIRGLPTSLDDAMRGMTSLTATYGDINKGQKIFSALNNAILGFGGTSMEVNNAITQLSQLPMDGPLDAQTWNSLRNSGLTPVLVAIAKDMGMGVNEMKKKFGEGELTVKDFTDALLKMNTEGGGGLKSLEQIAKDSTSGIQTGMANMQTAVSRGIAKIIEAIGSKNISRAIINIGKAFETTLASIGEFITKAIELGNEVFRYLKPSLDGLWKSIQRNLLPIMEDLVAFIKPLIPVIGEVLVFAVKTLIDTLSFLADIVGTVYREFQSFNPVIWVLIGAFAALKTAMILSSAFNALRAGFALLTNVTIPGAMVKMTALKTLIATPMIMPAIVIGAALGAIAAVMDAYQRMKVAVEGAKKAQQDLNNLRMDIVRRNLQIWNDAVSSPARKEAARRILRSEGVPGFANGVRNFAGGWAMVGERGPELVNLPKGSSVFSNEESRSMTGPSSVTFNGDIMLGDKSAVNEFFGRLTRNNELAQKGLAVL